MSGPEMDEIERQLRSEMRLLAPQNLNPVTAITDHQKRLESGEGVREVRVVLNGLAWLTTLGGLIWGDDNF